VNPSYLGRLLLLSSASFFLVQIIVGVLIALIAPSAIRRAVVIRPQRAAGFLLTLRLLPAAFSALVVAALCVPSYLRFEPGVAEEEVGFVCLAAAFLGAMHCAFAISRTLGALIRSSRYAHERGGYESCVEGERVWVVKQSAGLALAGILHPRLLISEAALRELSSDQLSVALRHEHAHRASLDNLKRLLILLAPSIFPGLRLLEKSWIKCAEWAADDQATAGDESRSAMLAAALVRIARLQAGIRMPPLVTSLVEADEDLSRRVDRLLYAAPIRESKMAAAPIAVLGLAALILSASINPGLLRAVHTLLEHLFD
jgi:beta-lactamase regulating signal transducer with metallopeptidase domain